MNRRALAALLLVGAIAPPARAAEPTKAEIALARQFFDGATAAENQGHWRDAIEQLGKAIAIKETAGLRYHLGFAKENLGLLADALAEYQRADALAPRGSGQDEVAKLVVPKLAEMRRRVPTLTVTVPADVKDAQLRIDNAPVKTELIGTPLPMNPGMHLITVLAQGRRPFHSQVTLAEGSTVTQAAEFIAETEATPAPAAPASPEPPPSTPASREPPPDSGPSAKTWVLIGEGAIALAAAGVGVGYLFAAHSAQSRYDDANTAIASLNLPQGCADPRAATECDNLAQAHSDHRHANERAIGAFATAGAGVVVLVTTWILWPSPGERRVAIAADLSPTTSGVVLRGSF